MHRLSPVPFLSLALLLAAPLPGSAQVPENAGLQPVHVGPAPEALPTPVEADRETVRRVLERPDVRSMASKMGIDVEDVENDLPTLSDEEVSRLAARARSVEERAALPQESVTVRTIWIIIGLLVLILLILIV